MNDYLSLIVGAAYGVGVFAIVYGWMWRKRVGDDRKRRAEQPTLFDQPQVKQEEKRDEVAMAHHA